MSALEVYRLASQAFGPWLRMPDLGLKNTFNLKIAVRGFCWCVRLLVSMEVVQDFLTGVSRE